jgi:class 3 adenylate cyclase
MESTGLAGRIQIGPATRALLGDEFTCEPRGQVAIKGRGELETFWLVGARGES